MRHHNSKVFPSRFPNNKGSNRIEVEPTLAHIDKLNSSPEMRNEQRMLDFIRPLCEPFVKRPTKIKVASNISSLFCETSMKCNKCC